MHFAGARQTICNAAEDYHLRADHVSSRRMSQHPVILVSLISWELAPDATLSKCARYHALPLFRSVVPVSPGRWDDLSVSLHQPINEMLFSARLGTRRLQLKT